MNTSQLLLALSLACPLRAMEENTNYFAKLPDEIVTLIAQHLAASDETTLKDCNAFLRTCKRFNAVNRDAIINQDNVIYRYTKQENRLESKYGLHVAPMFRAAKLDALQWMQRELEKNPTFINNLDGEFNQTLLHIAATYNAKRVTKLLLEKKADINYHSTGGWTAYCKAARALAADTTLLLLSNGADVHEKPPHFTFSAIHAAAHNNSIPLAELALKKGLAVDDPTYDNSTALHMAAEVDALEMAQFLLENKADINARNNVGWTPLFAAAAESKTTKVVQLLIARKANMRANDGTTLLKMARIWNNKPMIEFFEELQKTQSSDTQHDAIKQ